MATYAQLVREGKQALKDNAESRFRLGDLAVAAQEEHGDLARYAEDIGADYQFLWRCVRAAQAVTNSRYRQFGSWNVYFELSMLDDEEPTDVLLKLREKAKKAKASGKRTHDRVVVDDVREYREKRRARYPAPPRDRSEKAAAGRSVILDSEPSIVEDIIDADVAEAVVNNPTVMARIAQAETKRLEKVQAEKERSGIPTKPQGSSAEIQVIGLLGKARDSINQARDIAAGVDLQREESRDGLLEWSQMARSALDFFDSYVRGGGLTAEEELAGMTGEGA